MADSSVIPVPKSHFFFNHEPGVALCGHVFDGDEVIESDDMNPDRREQRYFDCAECWDRFRELPDE